MDLDAVQLLWGAFSIVVQTLIMTIATSDSDD